MSNHIKSTREQAGVSQLELAIKSDLHPSALARIEAGVRCNKSTAQKIAEALGEKPDIVFPDYKTLRSW